MHWKFSVNLIRPLTTFASQICTSSYRKTANLKGIESKREGEETELKINHVVSSKNIPVRINWQKSTDIYLAL